MQTSMSHILIYRYRIQHSPHSHLVQNIPLVHEEGKKSRYLIVHKEKSLSEIPVSVNAISDLLGGTVIHVTACMLVSNTSE